MKHDLDGVCSADCTSRRSVLAGAGAVGVAGVAALLTGCSTYGGSDKPPPASGGSSPGAGGNQVLAKVADIPVGGGKIFGDQGVVVTQPEKDTFKAFSATCTHQGCTVSSVDGGTINCGCHGSKFKIADGSVANGPATKPLPPAAVTVEGDSIRKA